MYISESFVSFQGTGHLVGVRQFFVRFAGCSVADCPIRKECDEPNSLTRKNARLVDIDELVEQAQAEVGQRGWMHITGGEPTDQSDALQLLVMRARSAGLYVHVQTSGIRRVPVQWDWLTVSPKREEPQQRFGQEMVVVDDGSITPERLDYLKSVTNYWCYYLCPLWGRDPSSTINLASQTGWDLTSQMHKHLGMR